MRLRRDSGMKRTCRGSVIVPRSRPTGFTLVELLVVVLLVAILAAVAVPQFTGSTDDAKHAAATAALASLRDGIAHSQSHFGRRYVGEAYVDAELAERRRGVGEMAD